MKTLAIAIMLLLCIPFAKIGLSNKHYAEHSVKTESVKVYTLDTLTIYHPVTEQCDDSPLITASNAKINLDKLRGKNIRWMALSRDMLKRWGGEIKYKDTLVLQTGDPEIDGQWIVHDTMNRRFKKKGDLLFHWDVRKRGRWINVTFKVKNNETRTHKTGGRKATKSTGTIL